jgi:hypothetical protein
MSGNDLPPLDECLSAMDERIEFLSSALSSLSEELTSRKPSGGAANPLAVDTTHDIVIVIPSLVSHSLCLHTPGCM